MSQQASHLLALSTEHRLPKRPDVALAITAAVSGLDRTRELLLDAPTTATALSDLPDVLEPIHFRTFAMTRDAIRVLDEALDYVSKITGSKSASHNVSMLALEALTVADGAEGEVRNRFLARLERVMGLHFVALSRHTDSIVYGMHTVDRLVPDDAAPCDATATAGHHG